MGIKITSELHDAIYKNAIWPKDLLENLSDPDYLSVSFEAQENGLLAKVEFLDEGKNIKTNYLFNKNDFLQRVEMIDGNRVAVLYDRLEEVCKILSKYNQLGDLENIKSLLIA